MNAASSPNIVIIGLGQSLRGDDAVGLAAVRLWQETYPSSVSEARLRVEMAELPGLTLLDLLDGADAALLVDAVVSGAAPGTLHLVGPDDLSAFVAGAESAHGWGVSETLALAHQLGQSLPAQIIILGIEAASFEMGAPLSETARQALPAAARQIESQLRAWLASSGAR